MNHETARVYDKNATIIQNVDDVLVANIEPHQTLFISSLVSVLRFFGFVPFLSITLFSNVLI